MAGSARTTQTRMNVRSLCHYGFMKKSNYDNDKEEEDGRSEFMGNCEEGLKSFGWVRLMGQELWVWLS